MDALSFLQDVAGYTQAQTAPAPRVRLATIDPAYVSSTFLSGTLPKVTFDGEATLSGKTYPVMAPYWPQASDRVVVVPFIVGNAIKYVIIGTLDDAAKAYLGGAVDIDGNLDVGGTITGASFSGISASDIDTGTLDSARLETEVDITRLRLTSTTDVDLASTGHAFQTGPDAGANLAVDTNEIQARDNGAANTLFLNAEGGMVDIGSGGLDVDGFVHHNGDIQQDGKTRWHQNEMATTPATPANVRIFVGDPAATTRVGLTTSRREFKQDFVVAELTIPDEELLKFPVVWYRGIEDVEQRGNDAPNYLGMVAEDVEAAGLADYISVNRDGKVWGVEYMHVAMATTVVVQRLLRRFSEQEQEIATLKADVEALKLKVGDV